MFNRRIDFTFGRGHNVYLVMSNLVSRASNLHTRTGR